MKYVLGFRFRESDLPEQTSVALIQKKKPFWQAGKLNGIGGKVEHDEDYPMARLHRGVMVTGQQMAMAREFKEETGVETMPHSWQQFGVLIHGDNEIYLFRSFCEAPHAPVLQVLTNERPVWLKLISLRLYPRMGNLDWLVPIALDKHLFLGSIYDDAPIPEKAVAA